MPAFIKTKQQERRWSKAKAIVRDQYPDVSEDSDKFWKLTNGIYQNMSSGVNKSASVLTDKQRKELRKIAGAGEFVGDIAGSAIGGKLGWSAGAALGTAIFPGVGTVIGGGLGWLAGTLGGGELGGKIGGMFDSKKPEEQSSENLPDVALPPTAAQNPPLNSGDYSQMPQQQGVSNMNKQASTKYNAIACYNIRKQAALGAIVKGAFKAAPKLLGGATKAVAKAAPKVVSTAGKVAGKVVNAAKPMATNLANTAKTAVTNVATKAKPMMTTVANKAKSFGGNVANNFKTNMGKSFAGGAGRLAKDIGKDVLVSGAVTAGIGALTGGFGGNNAQQTQQGVAPVAQPQPQQQPTTMYQPQQPMQ